MKVTEAVQTFEAERAACVIYSVFGAIKTAADVKSEVFRKIHYLSCLI